MKDAEAAQRAIVAAVGSGKVPRARLAASVSRVLALKRKLGLVTR